MGFCLRALALSDLRQKVITATAARHDLELEEDSDEEDGDLDHDLDDDRPEYRLAHSGLYGLLDPGDNHWAAR